MTREEIKNYTGLTMEVSIPKEVRYDLTAMLKKRHVLMVSIPKEVRYDSRNFRNCPSQGTTFTEKNQENIRLSASKQPSKIYHLIFCKRRIYAT